MTKTTQGNKGWDSFDSAWLFDTNSVEKDPQYYWTISDKSLSTRVGKMSSATLPSYRKMGKVIQLQQYPTQQKDFLIFGQYPTKSGHSVVVY